MRSRWSICQPPIYNTTLKSRIERTTMTKPEITGDDTKGLDKFAVERVSRATESLRDAAKAPYPVRARHGRERGAEPA